MKTLIAAVILAATTAFAGDPTPTTTTKDGGKGSLEATQAKDGGKGSLEATQAKDGGKGSLERDGGKGSLERAGKKDSKKAEPSPTSK
jgi:hypothetical protein